MHLLEKRLLTRVEDLGKRKKVCIVTGFFEDGDSRKIGTITQSFVCGDFRDGNPVTIVSPTEEYQFLTVYGSRGVKFTVPSVSWAKALRILHREKTLWGRAINDLLF